MILCLMKHIIKITQQNKSIKFLETVIHLQSISLSVDAPN